MKTCFKDWSQSSAYGEGQTEILPRLIKYVLAYQIRQSRSLRQTCSLVLFDWSPCCSHTQCMDVNEGTYYYLDVYTFIRPIPTLT